MFHECQPDYVSCLTIVGSGSRKIGVARDVSSEAIDYVPMEVDSETKAMQREWK